MKQYHNNNSINKRKRIASMNVSEFQTQLLNTFHTELQNESENKDTFTFYDGIWRKFCREMETKQQLQLNMDWFKNYAMV